jgi:calcineurin-like phosphoesterase family protein
MSNTFFTSDTHWYHSNIIKFCNRPFENVEEMNELMISKWNSVVSKFDTIYHLGDLSFCTKDKARELINRLNGYKHLIRGNHDRKRYRLNDDLGFKSIKDYEELSRKRYGQKIILSHYHMQSWNSSHHGSYHCCGHSHGTLSNEVNGKKLRRLDVGVDTHDFMPWSFEEVKEYMENIEKPTLTSRK